MTNIDIETELRATFADSVGDIPDDVAGRVARVDYQPRTRRRVATAGPLALVAVLGAGGAYAIASPGSSTHHSPTGRGANSAPQLTLSAKVMAAVTDASKDIAHVRITTPQGGVGEDWTTPDGSVLRVTGTLADGSRVTDETYVTKGDTQTATEVNYAKHTWSRTSYPAPTPPANCVQPQCLDAANGGFPPGGKGLGGAPLSTAAVQWLLTKGDFTAESGTETVNGVTTKKISSTTASITCTMWIDQATNLPVRVIYAEADQSAPVISTDVSWEPPTAANLATLQVVVPDGFTQVAGHS
jgi:hypothetical protein